ncbi:MAG: alpha/beta hydrolase [Chloroflexi bacterium]|nr:alpha/beta hydrolase [Chloroflexota bacterium]
MVQHPTSGGSDNPTVIFLPGGSGSRAIAERAWANFLSAGTGADRFRLVVPYSGGIDLIDDAGRVFGILDEVLACYGGDASQVHIGGTSNGGLASFALMLARPELFASLLGAPGGFPSKTRRCWRRRCPASGCSTALAQTTTAGSPA